MRAADGCADARVGFCDRGCDRHGIRRRQRTPDQRAARDGEQAVRDHRPCIDSRDWKFGSSSGHYWATVTGSFTESSAFLTTRAITDHVCVYLTKPTTRKYSRKGVVAHAFATYHVQKRHKKKR
jgi:hypothetical protein